MDLRGGIPKGRSILCLSICVRREREGGECAYVRKSAEGRESERARGIASSGSLSKTSSDIRSRLFIPPL